MGHQELEVLAVNQEEHLAALVGLPLAVVASQEELREV